MLRKSDDQARERLAVVSIPVEEGPTCQSVLLSVSSLLRPSRSAQSRAASDHTAPVACAAAATSGGPGWAPRICRSVSGSRVPSKTAPSQPSVAAGARLTTRSGGSTVTRSRSPRWVRPEETARPTTPFTHGSTRTTATPRTASVWTVGVRHGTGRTATPVLTSWSVTRDWRTARMSSAIRRVAAHAMNGSTLGGDPR